MSGNRTPKWMENFLEYLRFKMIFEDVPVRENADALRPSTEERLCITTHFEKTIDLIGCMRQDSIFINNLEEEFAVKPYADYYDWMSILENTKPELRVVMALSSRRVMGIINVLSLIIDRTTPGETIPPYVCHWAWAVLAFLPVPFTQEAIGNMRYISRMCWIKRARIDSTAVNAKELSRPYNIIIHIVGHIYRQRDMADKRD